MKRSIVLLAALAAIVTSLTAGGGIFSAAPAAVFYRPSPTPAFYDEPEEAPMVYVTRTGKCYHAPGCFCLEKSRRAMKLEEAKKSFAPCGLCRPDQLL